MGLKVCEVCEQTYVTMHMSALNMCSLCDLSERRWRRKVAAEVHALGGNTFIVESIKNGPPGREWRRIPGGMSDQAIPEFDPPPRND